MLTAQQSHGGALVRTDPPSGLLVFTTERRNRIPVRNVLNVQDPPIKACQRIRRPRTEHSINPITTILTAFSWVAAGVNAVLIDTAVLTLFSYTQS